MLKVFRVVLAALACQHLVALAQVEQEYEESQQVLAEVVVTAQRREQSSLDLAGNIQVAENLNT